MYHDSQSDSINNLQGVSMNQSYIFFWNLGNVWKLSLDTKELLQLPIYISLKETNTYVKKVRTGSDKNIICIRVS